ncbi:MAG: hypothetical protein IIB85_02705 [Chloroflexi bacterium]|nr:hypothetical protein [Chloroflexota bacterium]
MCIIMMPLATTELGTDAAITGIMEAPMKAAGQNPLWVLIYTSAIMTVLRFFAGPIVHKLGPLGLLAMSAGLAILGLAWLSIASGMLVIFAAATLYALGKTFFWPTTLGVVSEQCPKGGALTLNAIAGIGGVRLPTGDYNVVFGREAVMEILHHIVMPGLDTGVFYAAASPFMGKLGQQVASPKLTIIDDGAAPGLVGSKGITCEGLPTGRTELIKDGKLVGLLSNWYESQRIQNDPKAKEKLGADPKDWPAAFVPRNGFRYAMGGGRHFDSQPGTHATNILIPGDVPDTESICRLVGDGIYIGRIWYTYPVNGLRAGDFTGTVIADSYVIKDGRLAEPIMPNTLRITDNIMKVLGDITGVTREGKPTLVWAADEIVYAPEIAVKGVHLDAIAEYMDAI